MKSEGPPLLQYATSSPTVLLVEDDPTTRAFMAMSLHGLPARVDCAGSVHEALAISETRCHVLWLIDAQLPDGCGSELLARLRQRCPGIPAIAHTASTDRGVLDALIAAGFEEVLIKPLASSAIQFAVRRLLGASSIHEPRHLERSEPGKSPVWDDEAAARVLNHDPRHVQALRRLFLDELPMVRRRARGAIELGDRDALVAELHKLRASCGFVGATRLGDVARLLLGAPDSASLRTRFEEVMVDTLDTLNQGTAGQSDAALD